MRRHRRLDLIEGDPLGVDVFFRDSHLAPDGQEQIIHEYTVQAGVAPESLIIIEIEAAARALPWWECPIAAGSAGWLSGRPIAGLRPQVRAECTGPETCTHLNDTLRSLADIQALAALLAGGVSSRL